MNAQFTTTAPAAVLVEAWITDDPAGPEFTIADYAAIFDAAYTDPRIDADEVLAIAYGLYGGAIYYAAPWSCPECRGARTVRAPHPATAHLHEHDPRNQEDVDAPCPTCCNYNSVTYAPAVAS